jgi:hypothetical protein
VRWSGSNSIAVSVDLNWHAFARLHPSAYRQSRPVPIDHAPAALPFARLQRIPIRLPLVVILQYAYEVGHARSIGLISRMRGRFSLLRVLIMQDPLKKGDDRSQGTYSICPSAMTPGRIAIGLQLVV